MLTSLRLRLQPSNQGVVAPHAKSAFATNIHTRVTLSCRKRATLPPFCTLTSQPHSHAPQQSLYTSIAVSSTPQLRLSQRHLTLLNVVACVTAICATWLFCSAIPTLLAFKRAAESLEKLMDTTREELPDTMAAIRLSGMEISDLTTELSDLGQEITQGVRSSTRAVRSAEQRLRRLATMSPPPSSVSLQTMVSPKVEPDQGGPQGTITLLHISHLKTLLMSLIPDDLLTKILLRLPVKSLRRFKCVSKSWLSLISEPNFAKTHYELGAACTHRVMVIAPEALDAFSIDSDASLHDDSAIVSMKMNFLHRELEPCFDPVQIMGSCRGFLLLKRKVPIENLCLWNPSSGVHKALPTFSSSDFYGFGYDPSTDDYLVVCDKQRLLTDNQIGFFSLRDNSWKIVSTPFPYQKPPNLMPKAGTLLNAPIHWLAFNYNAKFIHALP
ncbi:hypothetical protein PIB30_061566 [Stylosanthes scabra]|uniref:F-box domain-containing protein n=1 Tax=Stylosanthes scabra TaxID=79078 RepID=A0ABU6WJC0_9FABA|nr:hypothetical protein [Stylosanthes scabra]